LAGGILERVNASAKSEGLFHDCNEREIIKIERLHLWEEPRVLSDYFPAGVGFTSSGEDVGEKSGSMR
jgi:hypothetical protein